MDLKWWNDLVKPNEPSEVYFYFVMARKRRMKPYEKMTVIILKEVGAVSHRTVDRTFRLFTGKKKKK